MADPTVVRAVDDLLALEHTSLLHQLSDSAAFVSGPELAGAVVLGQMVADEQRSRRELADLLDRLDATPGPRSVRAVEAEMNYTRLDALLPRLIEDKRRLIAGYESAARRVTSNPGAVEIIAAILGRHRDHLHKLAGLRPGAPR
jgi:hypothetical protein